jgi:wee1-like protein kinase
MAKELLDWEPVEDLTKCDVFSLGITLYELVTKRPLEMNGPSWHDLRNGRIPGFPGGTPSELVDIIHALMIPEPRLRLSAQACLDSYNSLKSQTEQLLMFEQKCNKDLLHKIENMNEIRANRLNLRRHKSIF